MDKLREKIQDDICGPLAMHPGRLDIVNTVNLYELIIVAQKQFFPLL
jgi:hypothetical protein